MNEVGSDGISLKPEISLAQEPGVQINSAGRIITTPWPSTLHKQWSAAYKVLGQHVAEQVRFELELRKKDNILSGGYYTPGVRSNLTGITLRLPLEREVETQFGKKRTVTVIDVGGGNGSFIGNLAYSYKRGHLKKPGHNLHTVMTTLVHHDREVLGGYKNTIDEIRTMAVELPPDNFYERFDIISAQKSVYFWSDHPELATLNLWKMLKKDGVVLATIPPVPRKINEDAFDTEKYLQSNRYFEYEELNRNSDNITVRLRRKDIYDSSSPDQSDTRPKARGKDSPLLNDLVLQFEQAARRDEIEQYHLEEEETFLQQLLTLTPEDIRSIIQYAFGISPTDPKFFERMKEKGWAFEMDIDTEYPGKHGADEHGYPRIGKRIICPGSWMSFSFEDIARIAGKEEEIRKLFGLA